MVGGETLYCSLECRVVPRGENTCLLGEMPCKVRAPWHESNLGTLQHFISIASKRRKCVATLFRTHPVAQQPGLAHP